MICGVGGQWAYHNRESLRSDIQEVRHRGLLLSGFNWWTGEDLDPNTFLQQEFVFEPAELPDFSAYPYSFDFQQWNSPQADTTPVTIYGEY